MKPNVDLVDLIAVQELSTAVAPTKDDYLGHWKDGELLGRKITIETVGTIISELLGSGQVIPDRTYRIVDNAGTLDVYVGGVLDPTITITNDGTGFPRIMEDPYLDGKDWSIWQRGVEYFIKGEQWQNDVVGGGFSLKQLGAQFEDGQEYFLVFKPQFSSVIVSPDAVGKFTTGEQVITADTAATDGMNRKLIKIKGATAAAVTFTLNATYPENVICAVVTGGGSNKQSIIQPPGGQTLSIGSAVTNIVLGEVDFAWLIRIGTEWTVVNRGDRWKHVGQIIDGGIAGPDRIAANGQTLLIADYPGLHAYLTQLNTDFPGAVVSAGTWTTNRTKWGRDGTNIYVKDLRGIYRRGLDLGAGIDPRRSGSGSAFGQIPGDYKLGDLLLHNHVSGARPQFNRLMAPATGAGGQTAATFGPAGRVDPWVIVYDSEEMIDVGGAENSVNDVGEPVYILI